MRIVLVNSMRSFGGGERWLLEVAEGLALRGHRIVVAGRPEGRLVERARDHGLPTFRVGLRGDVDPASIGCLAREIKRFGADLVSVNIQRAVRVGALAARMAGVRAIVERRGLLLPIKRSIRNRVVYRSLVSHVIANCRAIAEGLAAGGIVPVDRISVIPNGIDPSRVRTEGSERVREELGIPGDAEVVAVVGRLVPDKGHRYAIEAFARVAARRPGVRLVIAGGGRLAQELIETAGRVAPSGAVIFAGEREDVSPLMGATDVLLVTSLREGMPHVVLEAMAAGVPVVATQVAGIPEMIENGRHGLLVPVRSPDVTADAVLRVLADCALAKRLASEAKKRVLSEFSLVSMIERVEECFSNQILEGARERSRSRAAGGQA